MLCLPSFFSSAVSKFALWTCDLLHRWSHCYKSLESVRPVLVSSPAQSCTKARRRRRRLSSCQMRRRLQCLKMMPTDGGIVATSPKEQSSYCQLSGFCKAAQRHHMSTCPVLMMPSLPSCYHSRLDGQWTESRAFHWHHVSSIPSRIPLKVSFRT